MSGGLAAGPGVAPRRGRVLGLALVGYLAVSTVLWWHVWSTHPGAVATCGCEDPALSTWFLEWPAYALAHGQSPLYSGALFHPGGINLLSNTGMLALGMPLAPLTWLFGPVATFNVASTLGPALSALAMCWLLLRWVRWAPAAFLGGLAFGFSPYAVVNLAVGHLDLALLGLLPLMAACLDELLSRQRRPPVRTGVALGLLVVLQFFLSTEVLAVAALFVLLTAGLLLVYGALRQRRALARRLAHAGRGLAAGVATATLLLAYPLWFALAGPAHLSGLVWPTSDPGGGALGSGPLDYLWHLVPMSPAALRFFAGYSGPGLPQLDYVGLGLLVVVVAGTLVWRRDRLLWLFGLLGLVAVALSTGVQPGYWTPWRVLVHVPLVQDVVPNALAGVTALCLAVVLAVVVDHTHEAVQATVARLAGGARRRAGAMAALAGSSVALAVAAVGVVPMGTALAGNVPLTVQPVFVPRWFTRVAPTLPPGQVVLTFPVPVDGGQALLWQAVDSLHFALATGAGPGSVPSRAGPERAGEQILTDASSLFATLARPSQANVSAVRRALAGWGVTTVVVPEPAGLVPHQDRAAATAWALGFFTRVLGRPPRPEDGAWVWSGVSAARRP